MNQNTHQSTVNDQSSVEQTALQFALAHYEWQVLSADRDQWTNPDKQRGLAFAFLRYHAAKLALVSESEAIPETQN